MVNVLTIFENYGLGIPAAIDLNNGVTWSGELNSEFGNATSLLNSSQDCKISVI